jgi:AdoMet-dependent heme synthase
MRPIPRAVLAAALLLASAAPAAAQVTVPEPALRIFFITDVHSRHGHMERFVERANRDRPDLILDGGDMVHDGTESEFRRAYADRARLLSPWYVVKGNHDAERRGSFAAPPPALPDFRVVDHAGVRFFLLDNHREVLTDAQFERLERELAAGAGRRMVVVMHVPPLVRREAPLARLRHLLPFPLASPVMREPEQVRRFTELVERHGVLAVLTGHTHAHDRQVRGGVHYVVAGALGGLTPGLGIPNEYVEVVIEDREVHVQRIEIARPPGDPVTFVSRLRPGQPFLVIWETTQACDLACKHCRAEAQPNRHPDELTTAEAKKLLEDVRRFGPIIFVFSGGDALKRPDIVELVEYGASLGLRMAITPATTPLTTRELLQELKDAGLSRLAISLDGSHAGDPRRVPAGRRLVRARPAHPAHVAGDRADDAGQHGRRAAQPRRLREPLRADDGAGHRVLGGVLPGPDGPRAAGGRGQRRGVRGGVRPAVRPVEDGAVRHQGDGRAAVLARGAAEEGGRAACGRRDDNDVLTDGVRVLADGRHRPGAQRQRRRRLHVRQPHRRHLPVRLPAGVAGNIRSDDLVEVYRNAPLFRQLRDRSQLKGKCNVCEYRPVCGGSRARAYAVTGDYLEAEPFCAHVPKRWQRMVDVGEVPLEPRMPRRAAPLPVFSGQARARGQGLTGGPTTRATEVATTTTQSPPSRTPGDRGGRGTPASRGPPQRLNPQFLCGSPLALRPLRESLFHPAYRRAACSADHPGRSEVTSCRNPGFRR